MGIGEKASILPRSRKPASSLRAGERWPTRQARPPPRDPGRELTPLHPLAVPATSFSPARASHWGSAATRISPAVPLTRMLMFICTTLCRQCFHRWTQLCRHRRTSKSSKSLGHHCLRDQEVLIRASSSPEAGAALGSLGTLVRAPPGGRGRAGAARGVIGRGPGCLFAGDRWGPEAEVRGLREWATARC